jgi:hypothetical protein
MVGKFGHNQGKFEQQQQEEEQEEEEAEEWQHRDSLERFWISRKLPQSNVH